MERVSLVSDGPLEPAIVESLLYADLFDYPLAADEIHRYLPGRAASRDALEAALTASVTRGELSRVDGFFTLPGREPIVPLRQRRQALARAQWARARRYARLITQLPFVRLVAVSGTLAVENVEAKDDTDFLIVTAPGRLWLTRALVIGVVRLARLRGDDLCPNYLLTERSLALPRRDLFNARELVQLVPLYGSASYRALREANGWTREFLPNADAPPAGVPLRDLAGWPAAVKRGAERVLAGRLGDRLEAWERRRKIAKFSARAAASDGSAVITAECCKGHFDGQGRRIMQRFEAVVQARCVEAGLPARPPSPPANPDEPNHRPPGCRSDLPAGCGCRGRVASHGL